MLREEKSVIFIDENSTQSTSILAFAQILYSLNNSQSLAYINFSIKSHEYLSLLEQLFLTTQLKKEFSFIHIDYYLKQSKQSLLRGILAQSEYQNIRFEHCAEILSRNSYQVLVLDMVSKNQEHLDIIEEIIKLPIFSQIIIISNSDHFDIFKKYITKRFSATLLIQHNDITKYSSEKFSKISSISCSKTLHSFSSWLIIAYNFYLLKYPFPKRFFFTSNQELFLKEIFFISIVKKHLKNIVEYGNWDFITATKHHSKLMNTEYNTFKDLFNQSLLLLGITNIISNQTIYSNSTHIELEDLTQSQDIKALVLTNNPKSRSQQIITIQ